LLPAFLSILKEKVYSSSSLAFFAVIDATFSFTLSFMSSTTSPAFSKARSSLSPAFSAKSSTA